VKAFEQASGREIAHRIVDRRPGDVAEVYADVSRAARELGWRAARDIDEMCRDAWNWQRRNPEGYSAL
jgi:UDP-glucose 4-epimerase